MVTLALVILLAFLFLAPVVPHSLSVPFPFQFKPGVEACTGQPLSNESKCIDQYRYPPAIITGYSSISYRFLGLGPQPFKSQYTVTQANYSALVFVQGTTIVGAEWFGYPDPIINPDGVVKILNVSVGSSFGLANFTIKVKNVGSQIIEHPIVSVSFPGGGLNYSYGGIDWISGIPAGCPALSTPGSTCKVSITWENTLQGGQHFRYVVEVRGSTSNRFFVYRTSFSAKFPTTPVGPDWTDQFIDIVNGARNATHLTHDSSLDRFAFLRFNNSVTNYYISDYGLESDTTRFFSSPPQIIEVLLYPDGFSPESYVNFLKQYAPGHWATLTEDSYTRYGYYVGQGPYIVVPQPCAVTEIPSAGLNITSYFSAHGCSTTVQQGTWLVIELAK